MEDERLQLTVQLDRSDDELRVAYFDDKSQRLGLRVAGPAGPGRAGDDEGSADAPLVVSWSGIGADFVYQSSSQPLTGLDGINAALEIGDRDELLHYFTQARLVEVGHILFYALFGNSDRWEPVIRELFDEYGDPRPNPPRRSVRVRILTSSDELLDLPWRLAAWKGKFLAESGWTFEVVERQRAEPDVELETPCPVLVIAPRVAEMPDLGAEEHVKALQQILPPQYLTPTYLRVVETREQARDAFLGMSPKVLYFFGHAEIRGGQICLLLGDHDTGTQAMSAADFKRLMAGNYPLLAYINACKSGATGWHSVGYQLAPDVPVVIANATTAWTRHSTLSAAAWIERCLELGHDPIIAAHAVDDHVSTRGFEWGMRTIHANYGTWRADPLAKLGPIEPIGLRLDRDRSRERAYSRVASLVRTDHSRVQAFVSYAKPDSRLDLSARQLQDHLEDHAGHLAHITWRTVSFPMERYDLHAELRNELSLGLEAAGGEPLEYALRRAARGLSLDGATPVLWLDWGVHHHEELSVDELAMWVEFGSELAHICPQDIRLVSYIAVETAENPDPDIDEMIAEQSVEFITDEAFAIDLIPPLPSLTLLDIASFLNDRNNSRCPPTLIKDIAKLLFQQTGGNYARTIDLIERAEREGWYALRRELRSPKDRNADQNPD